MTYTGAEIFAKLLDVREPRCFFSLRGSGGGVSQLADVAAAV
jgi:hypothetical protein